MPTSGTWLWSPDLAEMVDEAFERAKVDPATLEFRHIASARRSMRFMLADWATRRMHAFRIRETVLDLVASTASYTLDGEVLDLPMVALRRDGTDTPVTQMGRQEYLDFPDKDTEGRPSRIFVDKQRDALVITLWPVPENSTDDLILEEVIRFEDHDVGHELPDIPYYGREAFAAGLAARLAEKYSVQQIEQGLIVKAEVALRRAMAAFHPQDDLQIIPGGRGRVRR